MIVTKSQKACFIYLQVSLKIPPVGRVNPLVGPPQWLWSHNIPNELIKLWDLDKVMGLNGKRQK